LDKLKFEIAPFLINSLILLIPQNQEALPENLLREYILIAGVNINNGSVLSGKPGPTLE